ncbi:NAD(P)H-binding protein [Paraburkholderia sp. SIMBA_053]|uniref:NmrA family NAD(P)-binding protein n=1 Tax=Paraburkholderia sp. SIMBA_053 TaxID=3085794 RepID=UPI00397CBC32
MHVVVAGASGRTGRFVVEQALAAGHRVTAIVRDSGPTTGRRASSCSGLRW